MNALPQAGEVILIAEDPHRVTASRVMRDGDGLVVVLDLKRMRTDGDLTGFLALRVDPNDGRFVRFLRPLLDAAARLTGRIWFLYYDERDHVRLYFGRPS